MDSTITLIANVDQSFRLFRTLVIEKFEKNIEIIGSNGFKLLFHGILLKSVSSFFNRFFSASAKLSSERKRRNGKPFTLHLPKLDSTGLKSLHDLIYQGQCKVEKGQLAGLLLQLKVLRPGLVRQVSNKGRAKDPRRRLLKESKEPRKVVPNRRDSKQLDKTNNKRLVKPRKCKKSRDLCVNKWQRLKAELRTSFKADSWSRPVCDFDEKKKAWKIDQIDH